MQDSSEPIEVEQLRTFVPLFSLSDERLRELAALAGRERLTAGVHLFHEGEVDNKSVYLLEGQVRLLGNAAADDEIVVADTTRSRHPLVDSQPRQRSAIAETDVELLCIDNNVLDYMITWDQLATLGHGAQVDSGGVATDEGKWMNKLLSALPFRNIPPANMQRLLDRMELVPVQAGEVVVSQGEPGDYYYVIDRGQARVTRQVELAELGEGAAFGEEALIADGERNASVTMTSDGVLLRLSKEDFDELLKQPLINWVSPADARERVNGGARWLDVRHAREYNHYRMPNAINVPLHELRQRRDELDRTATYICYCKTGRRSSAAAFLLSQWGFDVLVLRGGLQVLPAIMQNEGSSGELHTSAAARARAD